MRRRREIAPKIRKNTAALKKYLFWALVALVAGCLLAYLLGLLIAKIPPPEDQETVSAFRKMPEVVIVLTILTMLGFVFFGVRAYLMGTKVRHTILNRRSRLKR